MNLSIVVSEPVCRTELSRALHPVRSRRELKPSVSGTPKTATASAEAASEPPLPSHLSDTNRRDRRLIQSARLYASDIVKENSSCE